MAKSLPSKARNSRSRSRSRKKHYKSLPTEFHPDATIPSFPANASKQPNAKNATLPQPKRKSMTPSYKHQSAPIRSPLRERVTGRPYASLLHDFSGMNTPQFPKPPPRRSTPVRRESPPPQPKRRHMTNQSAPIRSPVRERVTGRPYASLLTDFSGMNTPQFPKPPPRRSTPVVRRESPRLPATLPQPKRRPMSPSYKHQSAPIRSPIRERVTGRPYASLLTDFSGMGTPQFEAKSFDKLFWEDFKKGQNIRKYIQKQIKRFNLELAPIHTTRRGEICKIRERPMRLFKYQTLNSVLGSPYSPIDRLLIVASTGTGKSCILVGIANYHLLENRKHHIVFVGATLSLYTNFIRQSMSCPGKMYKISQEHGWTDPTDNSHVQAFARHMKQFIVPLNYTQFGNMLSGKYKKYEDVDSLENKVVLMDEAHYLVDSINIATCEPMYTRVAPSWRSNLKSMYKAMVLPDNPYLKNVRLIGATATPLTSSLTEFLALANIFTDHPLPQATLCEAIRNVGEIEEGRGDDKALLRVLSTFNPIFSQSLTMYLSKTLTRVLDTNIFPEMSFQTIPVPMAESQERIIAKHWP